MTSLPICAAVSLRSDLMASGTEGEQEIISKDVNAANRYHDSLSGGKANQDRLLDDRALTLVQIRIVHLIE